MAEAEQKKRILSSPTPAWTWIKGWTCPVSRSCSCTAPARGGTCGGGGKEGGAICGETQGGEDPPEGHDCSA